MSKDKLEISVKDELNDLLNEYIQNIKNSVDNKKNITVQTIFSAFLDNTYYKSEYEPFIQDLNDIHSLINNAPLTALGFISTKGRSFTVNEIKDFQKEGRALISNLAKPLPIDEYDLSENNIIISDLSTTDLSNKILGCYTANIVQQSKHPSKSQGL